MQVAFGGMRQTEGLAATIGMLRKVRRLRRGMAYAWEDSRLKQRTNVLIMTLRR